MNAISGISATGILATGRTGGPRGGTPLTDEQKTKIKDILSGYDPSNITATSAKEIFQKFSDVGITPGRGVRETIEAAGFDAEQLRELGMPDDFKKMGAHRGGMADRPPLSADQKATVKGILSKYDPTKLSETDIRSILQSLRDSGVGPASDLKDVIQSAGFDAGSILKIPRGDGREQHFWASQSTTQTVDLSALQSLQSILNQYDLANITNDQKSSLSKQLQTAGVFQGSKIDLGV